MLVVFSKWNKLNSQELHVAVSSIRFYSARFENAASNQQSFSLEITTLKVIAASITIRLKKKIIYMSNIWLTAQCWLLSEPQIRL